MAFSSQPTVIPAKAGIQLTFEPVGALIWTPACAGVTNFFKSEIR